MNTIDTKAPAFTAGPWTVGRLVPDDNPNIVTADDGTKHHRRVTVATCQLDYSQSWHPKNIANARLIAAAPDLYAAAAAMVRWADVQAGGKASREEIQRLRAALAKANGEAAK